MAGSQAADTSELRTPLDLIRTPEGHRHISIADFRYKPSWDLDRFWLLRQSQTFLR
jgi:hypothetical protein